MGQQTPGATTPQHIQDSVAEYPLLVAQWRPDPLVVATKGPVGPIGPRSSPSDSVFCAMASLLAHYDTSDDQCTLPPGTVSYRLLEAVR